MAGIELSAGIVEYEETGGSGPVVVLLHGLAMGGSVWRHVVDRLREDHRCVVPTLPRGAHRRPMRPDADLSLRGVARLVGEFLERLDLRDVTLVENDHGHAQVLVGERPERVTRLVLSSCEAFDNYPPGLPGRTVAFAARLPGGLNALVQPLRLRPLRRLPLALGWLTKRPIPHPVTDAWLRPLLTRREIRRDLIKYLRAVDKRDMLAAAERLPSFDRPALVIWASEDRIMPPEHGRRLAELLPQGRLVEIPHRATPSSPKTSPASSPDWCATSSGTHPESLGSRRSHVCLSASGGSLRCSGESLRFAAPCGAVAPRGRLSRSRWSARGITMMIAQGRRFGCLHR